jgi:biopolymer transport protein ExbB/TolQ
MSTLVAQAASAMGWISPIIGVLAGIATILFFSFSLWESRTIRSRMRLRRRRRLLQRKLDMAAQKANLLLKQTAEAQALLVKQTAEQAALQLKHGELPHANKLPETRPDP